MSGAVPDLQGVLSQLEAKMVVELSGGHPYEALQYVQSFVARKKKTLGPGATSTVVFHGAKQLITNNASSSAGTLLTWYIEDGAGQDFSFLLHTGEVNATNYCDVQRVIDLVTPLSAVEAFPIIERIYDPLHLYLTKSKVKKTDALRNRVKRFEELSAKVFLESEEFYLAFKSYLRLGQIENAANTLLAWSQKGYASERGMFFGRGVLFLLSEGKAQSAFELLEHSRKYVDENIASGSNAAGNGGGADSVPLAVWHLASILAELAVMPAQPRVDKTKLFGLLYSRYGPFLVQVDTKLLEFVSRTGEVIFNFSLPSSNGRVASSGSPNPMAMLQGLLGGGASNPALGNGGNSGALTQRQGSSAQPQWDINTMLSMLEKMQAAAPPKQAAKKK